MLKSLRQLVLPRLLETAQGRLLASFAALLAALQAPRQINSDTWLNLVLGREIAASGLIRHNDLTAEAAGARWIDQQWLAHLVHYWLAQLLGLPGLVLIASLLGSLSLLAAAEHALRNGASPGRTLLAGTLALGALLPQSVRAQTFALPLLAFSLCRLDSDARSPSRRTWWLVPCAALWGNLHGSALLAPALALLLAMTRLLEARRWQLFARDLLLAACLAAALLLSPYGLGLLGYYAGILGNSEFRVHVGEWAPLPIAGEPTKSLLVALVLAAAVLGARRARSFPLAVCAGFALLTLRSGRHATPLALASAAFLPAIADTVLGQRLRLEADRAVRRGSRRILAAAVLGSCIATPLLARHTLRVDLPAGFSDRVALAARSATRVLADEHHADRLLWYHPELRGRLSHDVRFELLSPAFLQSLTQLYGFPEAASAQAWLSRYDLVVVDREQHGPLWQWLRNDLGWREIAADRWTAAFSRR
ncbi:MAG TPA: hypothetical protein VFS67_26080 [Polyangiaceae bacterium]|nr:hypothetical protein [Polyangiaceae bacterium]